MTWIHSDHLQSATALTDKHGQALRRLAYRAYGEETLNAGAGAAPRRTYTGQEHDDTGLYYYGARYDDPALASFITPDTVYDSGTQGLNRYSYALNNPIIYRDPTGHGSNPFEGLFRGLWESGDVGIAIGRQMQAETQGAVHGAVEGAATGGLIVTTMAVPGVGEALDLAVLTSPQSSGWEQFGAGLSLGYSLFTLGIGPNYGAMDDAAAHAGNYGAIDDLLTGMANTRTTVRPKAIETLDDIVRMNEGVNPGFRDIHGRQNNCPFGDNIVGMPMA